jgi:hypothetical protein
VDKHVYNPVQILWTTLAKSCVQFVNNMNNSSFEQKLSQHFFHFAMALPTPKRTISIEASTA